MAKKKRRRASRPVQEFESYLLELNDWNVSYGFSLGHDNLDHGPYWEHGELLIDGKLSYPPKFSGDRLKMTLLGNRKEDSVLAESSDLSFTPRAVGSLNMRGERREYLGGIPQSVMWGLLPALEAKKIKWISLHGEVVKWGKALIRSIHFAEEYEPEDYV